MARRPSFETGDLKKCLASGEYGKLKDYPLFEGNFVQVTRTGEVLNRVTIGIAASSRSLTWPDIMMVAQPTDHRIECMHSCPKCVLGPREELQLTALLPLKFVRIYVYNEKRYQFQVKLATGHKFYLQLAAAPQELDCIFAQWVWLLYRLHFGYPDAPINYQQSCSSYRSSRRSGRRSSRRSS